MPSQDARLLIKTERFRKPVKQPVRPPDAPALLINPLNDKPIQVVGCRCFTFIRRRHLDEPFAIEARLDQSQIPGTSEDAKIPIDYAGGMIALIEQNIGCIQINMHDVITAKKILVGQGDIHQVTDNRMSSLPILSRERHDAVIAAKTFRQEPFTNRWDISDECTSPSKALIDCEDGIHLRLTEL